MSITVTRLPLRPPPSYILPPSHHIGSPPTSFRNPWPSFTSNNSFLSIFHMRFLSANRNFVPVPASRAELVPIHTPDWGGGLPGLKATWIGHASFLVETSSQPGAKRGVRILLDPVFSERMSPVSWIGPKRFSPPPCKLEELPVVDVVIISHNHYDHLDAATVRFVRERGDGRVRFLCGLNVGRHLEGMGVLREEIVEMDWWEEGRVSVKGVGSVRLSCTPAQHTSGRGPGDMGVGLWCSWVVKEDGEAEDEVPDGKRLFFAGDTAYRSIPHDSPTPYQTTTYPYCPAFAEIGALHGPFDLALLPIGCYSPRSYLSHVHASPEDAIEIHKDVRSRKSVGMHYGTVRGGLSMMYEDVREPPRRWREGAEREELRWGEEVRVCGIGETVVV
ncbi:Metallo-hydrolase/oxidoreductase [Saccharata proteae CBS 121410]|uniref:Metallo-hydrolase/oxidoreductase n=1 Tax=Saccharata proteae CBS 121410 TaxID=1314787 RepID=A0A9P4I235_9PEZI|nr:Metallo-hydrolase/oxidoreductase [Saccharata proteae CBS 121410]